MDSVGSFTRCRGVAICAILCSLVFSKDPKRMPIFRGVLPLLLCSVYFILIIKQPNLSTAITIAQLFWMMFVAGLNIFYLIGCGFWRNGNNSFGLTDEDGYWMKRITSFIDPFEDPLDTGWQVIQS